MESEIEGVRVLLAGKPRPVGWAERRQRMDEICAIDPPAGDITFSAEEIGGIPAEWSLAPGSDPGTVLLYLHGGGYCSGSIRSHRGMVGEIGRAAGVRTAGAGLPPRAGTSLSRRARRRFGRLPLSAGKRRSRSADHPRRRQRRRRPQPRRHAQPGRRGGGAARPALAALALGGPGDDRRRAWRPRTPSIR